MDFNITYNGIKFLLSLKKKDNQYCAALENKEYCVDAIFIENNLLSLIIGGKSYEVSFDKNQDGSYNLYFFNDTFNFLIEDTRSMSRMKSRDVSSQVSKKIIAPMAGKILKLPVKKGDEVKEGEILAIIEAMKMQNEIKASAKNIIKEVLVKVGDSVVPQQALILID